MSYLTNPYRYQVADQEWTPNLSGTAGKDGLGTTNASIATLKLTMTSGNIMIGYRLKSVGLLWESQDSSPLSGTWEIKHYDSGDSQKGTTTQTTATAPAEDAGFISQTFDATNATEDIVTNDYFTLKCLQTDSNRRDVAFRTYPTCTGDCQYAATVQTSGYSINPVQSTWTYQ